jgi:hypothetical protein
MTRAGFWGAGFASFPFAGSGFFAGVAWGAEEKDGTCEHE